MLGEQVVKRLDHKGMNAAAAVEGHAPQLLMRGLVEPQAETDGPASGALLRLRDQLPGKLPPTHRDAGRGGNHLSNAAR